MLRIIWIFVLFISVGSGAFAESSRINILTYNVGLLQVAGVGDLVGHVNERVAELPKHIQEIATQKDVDIFVFQELWDKPHASAVRKILEPAYAIYRPNENTFVSKSSGLMLAVRKKTLELKHPKFFDFAVKDGGEKLSYKGWIEAELAPSDAPDKSFLLISTHLQCIVTDNGIAKKSGEITAHKSQVAQITSRIDFNKPSLFVGDLNVGPTLGNALFENALSSWKAQSMLVSKKLLATWDPKNPLVALGSFPNDPAAQVDHCLAHSSKTLEFIPHSDEMVFEALLKDKTYPLSDHFGYLVTIDIK